MASISLAFGTAGPIKTQNALSRVKRLRIFLITGTAADAEVSQIVIDSHGMS